MIYENAILSGSIKVSGSLDLNGEQVTVAIVPTITTVYPLTVKESDESYTIEITGSKFDGNAQGYLVGTDGNQALPTTSTRVSDTNMKLFYSSSTRLVGSLEPYDTVVVNGNGENATVINNISVNDSPLWITEAGRLGTIFAGTSITASFFISASDEEGAYPISYSLEVGTLPQGLTFLTASNEITGSSTIVLDTGSYNASGVQSNLTFKATDNDGVFATRNFNILKKWLPGAFPAAAANSAAELSSNNLPSGDYYVNIHGSPYLITYDASEKFSNGVSGWLKIDNVFVGSNNSLASFVSVGAGDSYAGWTNQSNGEFIIGNSTYTAGSTPNLGRMRFPLPSLQYGVLNTLTAVGAGSQTPDDTLNWVTDATHTDGFVNSYIALDTPTVYNDSGYPWAIWNGDSSANKTNGGIVFPNPGAVVGTYVGTNTFTFSGGSWSVVSYSSIETQPYLWVGSGDAADEMYTYTTYELWIH